MSPHCDCPSPASSCISSLSNLPLHSGAVMKLYDMSDYLANSDASLVESHDVRNHRPLNPGVYVPTVAFFHPDTEDLDLETTANHAIRLAKAGIAGITTQGSNGEAVHLNHKERTLVTLTTRKALDNSGYDDMPIIVGCGAQSTRETIELCCEAQAAGADYALVLPPAYYQNLFTKDTVASFFQEVASSSPIPVLIYNFPGAVSGIDLSSDLVIKLAEHPNIVGCKLTCGNTGKLNRIAAATRSATSSNPGFSFMCMAGSADFTIQALIGGGSGVICGLANIAPKACVKLCDLFNSGNLKEARKMQAIIASGDWAAIQGGLVSTKSALQSFFNYGGYARKPLHHPSKDETRRWREQFRDLVELEMSL